MTEPYARIASTDHKKEIEFYLTKNLLIEMKNIKHSKIKIRFQSNKIKFKEPNYTEEKCITKEKTYAISTFIPIKIKYENKTLTQWEISLI